MAKRAKELSALEVRRINEPGMYAAGGVAGLYFLYRSEKARSWILRVIIAEKFCDLGLGPYPEITLEKARDRAREAREQIRSGVDPRDARRVAAQKARAEAAKRITFREAARQCWEAKSQEFTNQKHATQWMKTLEDYAFPKIGDLAIPDITRAHVLLVLQPIWAKITDTASKLRGRIETVISYGYALLEITDRLNPAVWDNGLDALLPSAQKLISQNETHHPALPWQRMSELMPKIRAAGGMGARALDFQILTTTRSCEVRGAIWREIDFVERKWTIPPERMKGRREHVLPLSDEAIALLKALPRMDGCDLLFPSRKGTPLSDATLAKVIKDLHAADIKKGGAGFTDPKEDDRVATPHGTARSAFKDWARNQPNHNDDASELQIAHVNNDSTRAAYARDGLLPIRRVLVQKWAKFCGTPPRKPAQVVPLRPAMAMEASA